MKRKLFTLFVAVLAVVCLVVPMTVGAADDPTITLVASAQKVYAGDTLTVDVVVANNPGFWGPTVEIGFDKDRLELTNVANGEIYADAELADVNYAGNPVIISYNAPKPENNTKNGKLSTLTFKVKTDAPLGAMMVSITGKDIIEAGNGNAVPFKTVDADVDVYGKFETAELKDKTFKYDGNYKELEVTGVPAGTPVSYTYGGEPVAGAYKVGVYAVDATVVSNYYDDCVLTATMTIEPADLTLTAVDKAKVGTFTGIVGTEDVALDAAKVAIAKAEDGKWYATGFELTGADKGNYNLIAPEKLEVAVDEANDVATVTAQKKVGETTDTIETKTVLKGEKVTVTAPDVADYVFAKWTDGTNDLGTEKTLTIPADADITLTAVYEAIPYVKVTIQTKVGTHAAVVDSVIEKHIKGTSLTVTAPTVKDGQVEHKFKYWMDKDGKTVSTDAKYAVGVINEDITLTAYYQDMKATGALVIIATKDKKFTVSFDAMGAAKVAAQEVESGELCTMPATPVKAGYVFAGWYSDGALKNRFDFTTPVEENITLTAKWVSANKALIMTINSKTASAFGKTVENDVAPIIVNDRTMLPARFVAENLGAKVAWDGTTRKATITGNGVTIVLTIDSKTATINGKEVTLDSPAFIRNDRTYTPVRFIAEALGAQVEWNEATRQAIIIK